MSRKKQPRQLEILAGTAALLISETIDAMGSDQQKVTTRDRQ